VFIVRLLKARKRSYIWRTYQRRAYIYIVLCLAFNCFTEMRSSFIIPTLKNCHVTVKSPTKTSLTPCLKILITVFPPFGQFVNCSVLYVHSHHQSSAYSLVTTNNGSEPPGPFALSNIPDAMPDAKME